MNKVSGGLHGVGVDFLLQLRYAIGIDGITAAGRSGAVIARSPRMKIPGLLCAAVRFKNQL
ncbi:hypothetical protein M5X00_05360 [Paenibacillus alvei]|uniref:hypothetical protein n=1 Tax=Paenibacillus alvei TaxID=44250 RepID=UPI0002DCC416|nr:hypothetical protein [Paenibacillus alvei]MCY9540773.1 hypothetical protein [Paenibacillus alvei]MCY9732617.1 hypothetical protein [Paenibacillus alvei]MCY9753686.1 hypothetical protein [Paenibacillus alvei]MEC0078532.1 hypothetical protein [Paenibacillus alvei]